jgi:phosphatidylglycerophosphate synthase
VPVTPAATAAALIVGASPCRLWELDAHERLRRQLAQVGIQHIFEDPAGVGESQQVLVIDASFLFDLLTLRGLLSHPDSLLVHPAKGRVAAASTGRAGLDAVVACVSDGAARPSGMRQLTPAELAGYDRNLRKTSPPLLELMTPDRRAELEALLYGNSYKGITDFVTKWWWPRPARVVVGWCARLGITPNMVTLLGFVLVLAATFAFYRGAFALGLACGWIMTLLDTVDGKLARVSVASSRIGHILDHGIDIVHPPFWYVAWGLGLGTAQAAGMQVELLCWLVGAGYVAGRLIEAAFHQLGHCGMFSWRPFDAWFRLVTARRNPCLVILTLGILAGRADLAFVGVVGWTLASSAIGFLRLLYAAGVRWHSGQALDSWLKDGERAEREHPVAWRTFSATRGAYR